MRRRLNLANPQAVGVGVLLRGDHPRDGEGRQLRGRILDALDLQADQREFLDDGLEAGVGFQVVLEPGEGELHRPSL